MCKSIWKPEVNWGVLQESGAGHLVSLRQGLSVGPEVCHLI